MFNYDMWKTTPETDEKFNRIHERVYDLDDFDLIEEVLENIPELLDMKTPVDTPIEALRDAYIDYLYSMEEI